MLPVQLPSRQDASPRRPCRRKDRCRLPDRDAGRGRAPYRTAIRGQPSPRCPPTGPQESHPGVRARPPSADNSAEAQGRESDSRSTSPALWVSARRRFAPRPGSNGADADAPRQCGRKSSSETRRRSLPDSDSRPASALPSSLRETKASWGKADLRRRARHGNSCRPDARSTSDRRRVVSGLGRPAVWQTPSGAVPNSENSRGVGPARALQVVRR